MTSLSSLFIFTNACFPKCLAQGAKNIYTVPVGLDKTLLKEDYLDYNIKYNI